MLDTVYSSTKFMDALISASEIEEGMLPSSVARRGSVFIVGVKTKQRGSHHYPKWTPAEDQYLRDHLGYETEADIAKHLVRTKVAVHLRWKRDLHLPAPSRHPDYLSAHQAATLIGLDGHKLTHWCDVGLIPARTLPSSRHIRLINRTSFDRWVVSPSSWIYFNWKKIPDRRLRRLCELRAKRWGDEWWTTVRVARFHGATSKDVLRLITKNKTLPGVQVATSLGGRHKNPYWLYWYVRKSDAVEAVFLRGKGSGHAIQFTPRAEAWMLKAYKNGMSFTGIARSMGSKHAADTIKKNIMRLLKKRS